MKLFTVTKNKSLWKKQISLVSQVHNRNDINSCVKDFQEILPNIDIVEKDIYNDILAKI